MIHHGILYDISLDLYHGIYTGIYHLPLHGISPGIYHLLYLGINHGICDIYHGRCKPPCATMTALDSMLAPTASDSMLQPLHPIAEHSQTE